MSNSLRRSTRSRKANTKYAHDGWDKETLRLLRRSSESSNPTSTSSKEDESAESDTEFDQSNVPENVDDANSDGDEDEADMEPSPSSNSNVSGDDGGENEISDNDNDNSAKVTSVLPRESRNVRSSPKPARTPTARVHSRGVIPADRSGSIRSGVWQSLFGPQVQDLKKVLMAKERWLYSSRDVTIPSWATIAGIESDRQDEVHRLSHHSQIDGVDNNNDQICSERKVRQKLRFITFQDAQRDFFVMNGHDHKIVLGPWSRQHAYALHYMKPTSLGQAWKIDGDTSDASYHSGWLINVGEKPQCMAWSTRTLGGQYLALACRSTPQQRDAVEKVKSSTSPAFSTSASYPMSIQVWRVVRVQGKTVGSYMDFVSPPQLVQIIAGRFGEIRQLVWAPESIKTYKEEEESHLGMLTVLSSDGCIRLIHVPMPAQNLAEPLYMELDASVICIRSPANSVFTCFTFSSPSDLVVGSSSGYVHAYNLSQWPDTNDNLQSYFDHQLHPTYITAICAVNDENSHFLASASAAGTIQLTDLRSPSQDTLALPRARLPSRNLIFIPDCQSFITTIDGSGATDPHGNAQTNVVAHTLRHFYTAIVLSKTPESSGIASVISGSAFHPHVLLGSSNGTVWAQNVARRIFPTGKPDASVTTGAWIQKLFEYEWIPSQQQKRRQQRSLTTPSSGDGDGKSHNDNDVRYHGWPVRPGISRMHLGFKLERLDLSKSNSMKKKRKTAPARKSNDSGHRDGDYDDDDDDDDDNGEGDNLQEGRPSVATAGANQKNTKKQQGQQQRRQKQQPQLMFEEEQAVTCMEWSRNALVAGWCAVGWGSGVVLITDLGHAAT